MTTAETSAPPYAPSGDADGPRTPRLAGLRGVLIGAAAFTLAAYVGRLTVVDGVSLSLVWPASGVAVLWFLLRGAGPLSWDSLALVVVTVVANLTTGAPPPLVALFVVVNLGQALLNVHLLRRFCGHLWGCGGSAPIASLQDLWVLTWTSAAASAAGAAIGVTGLQLVADATVSLHAVAVWWVRVVTGTLVVLIVGLLAARRVVTHETGPMTLSRKRLPEVVALVALSAIAYPLVFLQDEALVFVLLAFTIWSAMRFSTLFTAVHTLASSITAIVFTLAGHGQFGQISNPTTNVLLVGTFVTLMLLLGMFVAVVRDERSALVDRLEEADEQSRAQAQLVSAIIDSINQGVVVVDAKGQVVLRNQATAQLIGIPDLQTSDQGLPVVFLPSGDPIPPDQRPSLRVLRGEEVVDEDLLLQRDDGTAIRVRVSASHLPPLNRQDTDRVVLVFHDVTESVEREEALKSYAATVAHDLNNPLAAILGWNAMVLHELESGEYTPQSIRELSTRVDSSAKRLHQLIEGLLENAASKDRNLQLTRVDLDDLVRRIVSSRGVEGQVHWADLPHVRADQLLASQVVDNLIGNALKYVEPGTSPEVTVSAAEERPGWVTVRVADNGIGIPAGQHDSIFDEFHRAHGGYQGTGLGLSIVRRIITRHGGMISATPNHDGHGTVFAFTLPAA